MAAYAAVVSLTRILQELMDPHGPVLNEKQQIQSLQEKKRSMAYAAVLFLTRFLQQIMDRHAKQQIECFQEMVGSLLDFLENYSVYTEKVVKDLEIEIRDATYEAEYIIESYVSTSILSRLDGESSIGEFETGLLRRLG
ncbi:uncharacterized protein [Henckelia pumila]|uniref:uncharacterized protein n=1 Tax=Henckelia pumila TaxID=405737 RepID=UPI003C6DBAC0